MRVRMQVAYDGRPFKGWQSQRDASGVQDHLENALGTVLGAAVRIHGAGRTDAGVHALAQSVHADLPPTRHAPERLLTAVNAHLPPEIRVLQMRRCADNFHARFSAQGKTYRYHIWNGPVFPPHLLGRAWHFPWPVDLNRLRDVSQCVVGRRDFRGFSANRGAPVENTERNLLRLAVVGRPGGELRLTFRGDGFLYRMVRLLTGELLRVASGRQKPERISQILAGREQATHCAPAEGLWLVKVHY